jgi:hypothetical protein
VSLFVIFGAVAAAVVPIIFLQRRQIVRPQNA